MNIESLYRIAALVTLSALMGACSSMEWSASRIDSESDEALVVFQEQINGAEVFLNQAAGFLVFTIFEQ